MNMKEEHPEIIEEICKKCKYYIGLECDGNDFEELNNSCLWFIQAKDTETVKEQLIYKTEKN